jgi:uncharacterized protein (DUF1697 family)
MPAYVALLKAVNVAGHQPVKMADLHESFVKLGHQSPATYLQSGNVVFQAPNQPAPVLSKSIEARLAKDFRFPIRVLVISGSGLQIVRAGNPFAKNESDPAKLLVTFLFDEPAKPTLAKLEMIPKGKDRFAHVGKVLYLHCPDGYGKSKLANPNIERMLKIECTTRNWRTVGELCKMAGGESGATPSAS